MARIAGVDLPPNKRVEIGLTYIFGIGRPNANKILQTSKVDPNTRVKDLPDIALLATIQPLEARRLRAALERTFEFRATHPLPASLPDPRCPCWPCAPPAAPWPTTPTMPPRTSGWGGLT